MYQITDNKKEIIKSTVIKHNKNNQLSNRYVALDKCSNNNFK